MTPVIFSDHPDLIGGIKWSNIELDWINARIRKEIAETINHLAKEQDHLGGTGLLPFELRRKARDIEQGITK